MGPKLQCMRGQTGARRVLSLLPSLLDARGACLPSGAGLFARPRAQPHMLDKLRCFGCAVSQVRCWAGRRSDLLRGLPVRTHALAARHHHHSWRRSWKSDCDDLGEPWRPGLAGHATACWSRAVELAARARPSGSAEQDKSSLACRQHDAHHACLLLSTPPTHADTTAGAEPVTRVVAEPLVTGVSEPPA